LKPSEEWVKDHGQENRPNDRREKRGEDLVEKIDGKECEEKDEDEKDMFPFHILI
jgi:hypothetical protein